MSEWGNLWSNVYLDQEIVRVWQPLNIMPAAKENDETKPRPIALLEGSLKLVLSALLWTSTKLE